MDKQKSSLKNAERILKKSLTGNKICRIKRTGTTACVEVDENEFINVLLQRDHLVPAIQEAGFSRVALNLQGFQNKEDIKDKTGQKRLKQDNTAEEQSIQRNPMER